MLIMWVRRVRKKLKIEIETKSQAHEKLASIIRHKWEIYPIEPIEYERRGL